MGHLSNSHCVEILRESMEASVPNVNVVHPRANTSDSAKLGTSHQGSLYYLCFNMLVLVSYYVQANDERGLAHTPIRRECLIFSKSQFSDT